MSWRKSVHGWLLLSLWLSLSGVCTQTGCSAGSARA